MNPATLALIVGLVEEAVKEFPHIRADLNALFTKADPTPADWLALKGKVLAVNFEALAPDAVTTPTDAQPTV